MDYYNIKMPNSFNEAIACFYKEAVKQNLELETAILSAKEELSTDNSNICKEFGNIAECIISFAERYVGSNVQEFDEEAIEHFDSSVSFAKKFAKTREENYILSLISIIKESLMMLQRVYNVEVGLYYN